jgi:CRISPR-associated endoribonuclease Cas6
MRIYLKLTPNTETCPFSYQGHLVQKFHEWLGKNQVHDDISLYSLSWLSKGEKAKSGFNFPNGTEWFISSYDENIIKSVIKGIQKNSEVAFGMFVKEVSIIQTPEFSRNERFQVASPVFIKRNIDEVQKYYYFNHKEANQLLTETLQNKLKVANLDTNIQVKFDKNYRNSKIKGTFYKKHRKKGSVCPVILEGSPEAIAFAWNVGIGNGTGIGFGALI